MAKSTTTKSTAQNAASEEILDAVDESSPATEAKQAPPSKTEKDMEKVDDRNPVMAFIYDHPWITLFIFYLILGGLVRIWGWATIIFLAIPVVCFLRLWLLTRNLNETIDQETHEKIAWWSKVGLYCSVYGLASIIILDTLGILHVFGE